MVLHFFNCGRIFRKFNLTQLVLIPKVDNPEDMTYFRPISLCNILYRIIAKILANRLIIILLKIISTTQSAFIPGRLITDNVLVAYDLNHFLKNKREGKDGHFSLKLDMSKAYDRIEGNYLKAMMIRLGSDCKWVDLIMECVTSVSYTILHNGDQGGFIRPERGRRQRDPLSLYLFLLFTHLLFADDSIIYGLASVQNILGIKDIL